MLHFLQLFSLLFPFIFTLLSTLMYMWCNVIIFYLKFIEDNLLSLKIELFLKVFLISLSLQIYHSIILDVLFSFKETWVYLINIIIFWSGLYFLKFCYSVFFPVKINILKFQINDQNSHSHKEIIMIIKTHHKFTINITQIIDK